MTRDEVLARIAEILGELTKHRVSSLALFGSAARNALGKDSDIDILVEFSQPVGLFEFVRLKRFLETVLGRPVDLATPDALKRQFREEILKEAVRAA
jgi:predicted nucleotidyltransferase